MMRKALKRVLDQLRAKTNDAFRSRTATRSGLQEPQQMSRLGVRP
jgi:hypothetical protein